MNRDGIGILAVLGWMLMAVAWSACSAPEPEDDAATLNPELLPARAEYRTHCSACHGRNGAGAPRLYPPLRGSSWVNGNPEIPIRAVLHGIEGPITVEGEKFMNKMTPLGERLADKQIARILTFVRASWGNTGGPVTEETVARVRAATADRREPWTAEELEPLR